MTKKVTEVGNFKIVNMESPEVDKTKAHGDFDGDVLSLVPSRFRRRKNYASRIIKMEKGGKPNVRDK